ncbi:choice-of-anchor Q domain-containing protein [Cognatilysobacter bugurensis]|uniref:Big-1 domain-containing protein n=1 Tax=Cognatilysobacter bugurensis TaxID=543356 RepID=A0A918SZD8_9GAMM|nr:choice-of-anchor Q domain-containing protein [Lysobacter bugurensis]GHA80431.1 hypothetical protein GCM10007067_17760 [Lysobacter bugurensis]
MTLHRRSLVTAFLVAAGLAASAHADAATTYYVRTDGGDARQCNGRSDAAYPGSGSARHCAWRHPFFALPPGGAPRIAGGDTLIIGGGSYEMGQGAPGAGRCGGASCYMAAPPSGPSATRRTRILGKAGTTPQLWGSGNTSRVLNLDRRSNIEIGNLEVTDRSDCVYAHTRRNARCATGGDWARVGLYARHAGNVWLHDLNIHGLAHMGMNTGALSNWRIERVRINKNGRAGWDAGLGGTAGSNSGPMVLRNVEVAWNGCGERWRTGEVWACWAQQTGGYGDGIGTYYTGGQWLIEDSFIHHNTSDGLDLRYMDGAEATKVVVRRLHAEANAGNQAKIRGNLVIENSVLVGNCAYWKGRYYMTKRDACRASGNALQLVLTSSDVIAIRHNTITGEGGVLIGANEGQRTSTIRIENNLLIGQPRWDKPSVRSSVYHANKAPARVTWAGNLVWRVKNGTCPTGSVCNRDPQLKSLNVDRFDATPHVGSPAIDRVSALAGLGTDFLAQPRPYGARSDIGAYELQPGGAPPAARPAPNRTCTRAAPSLRLAGPTGSAAAGTARTYTVTLRNNDSAACANTGFNLARTVPSGWAGTLSRTRVTLAPGASTSATLSIRSSTGAVAKGYGIGVGAGSGVGAAHRAKTSMTYAVRAPGSAANAGFSTTASTTKSTYAVGDTVVMTARVLRSGKPVAGAHVRFVALKPNRANRVVFKATTDRWGIARASFKSGSGSSSIGTYTLTTTATSGGRNDSARHAFAVGRSSRASTERPRSAPAGFTSTVATHKARYRAGSTVHLSSRVLKDGKPVANARVQFTALKPNGRNKTITTAYTDRDGYARKSIPTGAGPSSVGTYKLSVVATSRAMIAKAAATFSTYR